MPRFLRGALLAAAFGGAGACAVVAGLDQIEVSPCAPDCGADASGGVAEDAAPDQTTGGEDVSTTPDSTTEPTDDGARVIDAAGDATIPSDADAEVDADAHADADGNSDAAHEGGDATHGDGGIEAGDAADAESDGSHDAPQEAPQGDAAADSPELDADASDAVDSGPEGGQDAAIDAGPDCGPLDTTANCSACGVACDTQRSTGAACNGTTCVYTGCAVGASDCNKTAPDMNGCECATPGCCGTSCQTMHTNGVGQGFFDCTAAATYNATTAGEACAAFAQSQGAPPASCGTYGCGAELLECYGDDAGCSTFCWPYTGAAVVGFVTDCSCPGSPVAPWQ